MDDVARMYRELTALQGIAMDEKRAPAHAELLRRQLAIEAEATKALAFEVEPAAFVVAMRTGSR